MDSDEYFDEIIEIDFGDVSDKENENNKSPNGHSSKTINVKKEQFELIARVMNGRKPLDINISELWNEITPELNALGPPMFTILEWRRKWTQHKYNKKRRSNDLSETASKLIQPPDFIQPFVEDSVKSGVTIHYEILEKLEEVVQKQNLLIEKQDVIIGKQGDILEKLDHSSSVLQEIAKKASKSWSSL